MIFLPSRFKPLIRVLESPGPDGTSVDDLKGISIYTHVGKGITTMLCKTNPEGSTFFTFRRGMLIMGSIKYRLIEGIKEHDADIRGYTIQDLKGDLASKGGSRYVVKYVAHILEGEQPAIGWSTSPVHDGVSPGLDGSVLPLSRVFGSDDKGVIANH